MACGEKLAYGYRRVAWWLQRKQGLRVNRKRVLRVMRERGLLVRSRRLRARQKKESGGGGGGGGGMCHDVGVSFVDCCARGRWSVGALLLRAATETAGLRWTGNLHRCARAAVVGRIGHCNRQPDAEFTSTRFIETLNRLGITHRRTAYHHPGGQQLHRTVPSQLERGGSLDGGVIAVWRKREHRSRVGSRSHPRSASPRSEKSHTARGLLEFCQLT